MKKGRAFGMNLDTLEKMCRALECRPGDVLKLGNNNKKNSNHRKTKTKSK